MTVNQTFEGNMTRLVGLAVLAPSSHNTQPWRFRTSDAAIDVFADRTRALPVNDPEDRELTISCGCALFNLRAAAAAGGLGTAVTLLPAPDDADWLARISHDPQAASSATEAEVSQHIERRRQLCTEFDGLIIRPGLRFGAPDRGRRTRRQPLPQPRANARPMPRRAMAATLWRCLDNTARRRGLA